jgi:hypothetical protein
MADQKIRVRLSGDDAHTAYVALPGYPKGVEPGIVWRTIDLSTLVDKYSGPQVHLDFNKEGVLIGIEILVYTPDD